MKIIFINHFYLHLHSHHRRLLLHLILHILLHLLHLHSHHWRLLLHLLHLVLLHPDSDPKSDLDANKDSLRNIHILIQVDGHIQTNPTFEYHNRPKTIENKELGLF